MKQSIVETPELDFWNTTPTKPSKSASHFLIAKEYRFIDDDTIEVVASSGEVNRLNEVLDASALNVDNYLKNPVVLWMHNWNSLPIGKTLEMFKDGSKMIHRITFSPLPIAQDIKRLYQEGFLNAWSYGFTVESIEREARGNKKVTRITDGELLELSAVTVPADANALSTYVVRSLPYDLGVDVIRPELYGVIPYKETPKADEDVEWDVEEEVAAAEVDDLKLMCAWFDSEYPDAKASYKLPHHLHESPHKVVWSAVAAAGAAIMGARGGVDIPDSDVAGVKSHLAKHYAQFDKVPPWEAESSYQTSLRRIEHLANELRKSKQINDTDLAMLREIIMTATKLSAKVDQDNFIEIIDIVSNVLGKEVDALLFKSFWLSLDKLVGKRLPSYIELNERINKAINALAQRRELPK